MGFTFLCSWGHSLLPWISQVHFNYNCSDGTLTHSPALPAASWGSFGVFWAICLLNGCIVSGTD